MKNAGTKYDAAAAADGGGGVKIFIRDLELCNRDIQLLFIFIFS